MSASDSLQLLAEIDRDLRLLQSERRRVLSREGRLGALAVMRSAAERVAAKCDELMEAADAV